MDESSMPENCVIVSPEELVRLGVNIDKLTTASDEQSIAEHGKQLENANTKNEKSIFNSKNKRIVQLAWLKILKDKPNLIPATTSVNDEKQLASQKRNEPPSCEKSKSSSLILDSDKRSTDIDKLEIPTHCTSSLSQQSESPSIVKPQKQIPKKFFKSERSRHITSNLSDKRLKPVWRGVLNPNKSETNIKQHPILTNSSQNQSISEANCSGIEQQSAPQTSTKTSVKILSNTEVYIPSEDLRKLMPANKKDLQENSSGISETVDNTQPVSDLQMLTIRRNLARILKTDKLVQKKIDRSVLNTVKKDYNYTTVVHDIPSSDAYETLENQDLKPVTSTQYLTSNSVLPDFHQEPINSIQERNEYNSDEKYMLTSQTDCKKTPSSDHIKRSNKAEDTFCTTLNVEGFTITVKEIRQPEQTTEDSSVIRNPSVSNPITNEHSSTETQDISYKSKGIKQTSEMKTIRYNLNRILRTGDPSYKFKEKELNAQTEPSNGGISKGDNNNRTENEDDIFEEYLPKNYYDSKNTIVSSDSESDISEENQASSDKSTYSNDDDDENNDSDNTEYEDACTETTNIEAPLPNRTSIHDETSNLSETNLILENYDTSSIDYKESDENINVNLCFDEIELFPPETPIPNPKNSRILKAVPPGATFFTVLKSNKEKRKQPKRSRTRKKKPELKTAEPQRRSSRLSKKVCLSTEEDEESNEEHEEVKDTVILQLYKKEKIIPEKHLNVQNVTKKQNYTSTYINCMVGNNDNPVKLMSSTDYVSKEEEHLADYRHRKRKKEKPVRTKDTNDLVAKKSNVSKTEYSSNAKDDVQSESSDANNAPCDKLSNTKQSTVAIQSKITNNGENPKLSQNLSVISSTSSYDSTVISKPEKNTADEDKLRLNDSFYATNSQKQRKKDEVDESLKKESSNHSSDDDLNVIDKDTNKTNTSTLVGDESHLNDSFFKTDYVKKRGKKKRVLNNEKTRKRARLSKKSTADDVKSESDDCSLEQLRKKRKCGNKNKLIYSSESDNDEYKTSIVDENEFSESNSDSLDLAVNSENIENPMQNKLVIESEYFKTRKRGRAKTTAAENTEKNSKPKVKVDIIGTPGRDRKRKEISYSLLGNTSLESSSNNDCPVSGNKTKLMSSSDSDNEKYSTTNDNNSALNGSQNKLLELAQNDLNNAEPAQSDSVTTASKIGNEQTVTKKKRGRPKKNATETPPKNSEPEIDHIVRTSGRGRKRKEVSYSLLEKTGIESSDDDCPVSRNKNKGHKNKLLSSSGSDNKECDESVPDVSKNKLLELSQNDSITTENDHITTKKKRGRPKKNATETPSKDSESVIEHVIGTSGRGRKRKEISYSQLGDTNLKSSDEECRVSRNKNKNNNDSNIEGNRTSNSSESVSDKSENKFVQLAVSTAQNDTVTTIKKRGRPRKNTTETPSQSSKPEIDQIIGTTGRSRKKKEINNSLLENTNTNNIESSDDISVLSNKNSEKRIEELDSTDNSGKNKNFEPVKEQDTKNAKKYKWTGITTTTLKQIFTTLQGKNAEEVSHDASSGLSKRKGGTNHDKELLLDENGSLCMVCNKTIDNKEWITHKSKEHYNLAWKKGEAPVDISDTAVIQKALTDVRKQQGYLKCNSCGKRISQIKTFISHLEICNGIVDSSGHITCAVCGSVMEKKEWPYHKYKEHNNLAWREGDHPLNLQDQDLVVRILTQLYKAKKPLRCELCKQQKKSVLGYLSHKSVCQVSDIEVENVKVACKICGKKILPVSMDYHIKAHNKPKELANHDLLDKSEYFNINLDNRKPRKAAMQALKVIKSVKGDCMDSSQYYTNQCDFDDDFAITELKKRIAECPDLSCIFTNCGFQTNSLDTMVQHLNSCDQKPKEYFICKICLTWCNDENEIKDHIKTIHKKIRTDDADQDAEFDTEVEHFSDEDQFMQEIEMEKKRLVLKGKINLMNNQRVKPVFLIHPIGERLSSLVYAQAYPWMFNFCEKYYANLNLFETLRNNRLWQVIDCDILNDYLPRCHESGDITVKTLNAKETLTDINDVEFKKLGLFEVCNFYKGEATIYCGGPVTALSWLPTPYNQETHNQILAVAVLNEADKEFVVGQTYNEPYVLQFWSIGQLHWHQVKDAEIKPSLLYGLVITAGPIWHLEWCPSGCLDLSENKCRSRLGLLAVATSDSFAYIYSIDNLEDDSDRGLIYKGESVVKLQLEAEKSASEQKYYATRISWTKAEGHRYIAVGYSTGVIALFDLLSTSDLFKKQLHAGTQVILPYQTFQAHLSCITALTLGHFGNGNRWCFSAAFDKKYTFWDLSNTSKLVSHRKYGVADGVWPTQWPVCLLAEDESSFSKATVAHTLVKPIRDVTHSELCNFTLSPSGINTVSFSDWLNLIIHGGNAGDVFGQFAHRIYFYVDSKQLKKTYTKCVFSVTKLIKKDGSEGFTSTTYDDAITNYKMAFIDYNSNDLSKIPNSKHNEVNIGIEKYDIRDYPLQAISKIAVNPNPQACTFYAAGYQAGFIRIRAMEFLSTNFKPETFPGYDFSGNL